MKIFNKKNKDTNVDNNKKEIVKKKKKNFYLLKIIFVIFLVVSLYIAMDLFKVFNKKSIGIYEVTSGEIVNVDRHKGFIFRSEYVETCKNDGYINFFVSNGKRVNRGAFIYTINDDESVLKNFTLLYEDKVKIKQNIKMQSNRITDLDFSNIYISKDSINNQLKEINIVKQLENIDVYNELVAKEKGFARHAGLISYIIDGYEDLKIESFNENLIKQYDTIDVETQKNNVKTNDKIYKIILSPEFEIAFDSNYDYDNFDKNKTVSVKFVYENVSATGHIRSFIGNDGKKHFSLVILDYPERFIDKRVVEFEIENKKISGLKIPIKSIVSKNCYVIPKNMLEKDFETDENIIFKLGLNGDRVKVTCNISKEDENNYYISIDDSLSKLKFGDVLTNRYNDTFSLSDVKKLNGVYNVNKGYAIFKNIDIIDKTNEYAIIKGKTINGISLYDHIALDSSDVVEGNLIS